MMGEISVARRYYWSLRRELWENPAIWVVPLVAGGLAIVGFLIGAIRLLSQMHSPTADTVQQMLLGRPYDVAEVLIMLSAYVVAIFYCLDALYGERRDRSILFWKSLPVSDATTVLAKATIPLFIIPLVTVAVTIVTFIITNLSGSAVSALAGVHVATNPSLLRASMLLFYHLITVHALGWAPFFGWMLLISAWARRAPLVWAVVPAIGISLVERIAFDTSYFANMLKSRFDFSPEAAVVPGKMPTDPMTHLTPGLFVSSPGLWIGLAVAAIFLVIAVRLRRAHGPN